MIVPLGSRSSQVLVAAATVRREVDGRRRGGAGRGDEREGEARRREEREGEERRGEEREGEARRGEVEHVEPDVEGDECALVA